MVALLKTREQLIQFFQIKHLDGIVQRTIILYSLLIRLTFFELDRKRKARNLRDIYIGTVNAEREGSPEDVMLFNDNRDRSRRCGGVLI